MFNPKTPVSDLYADYVTAKPQYFDLSTGEYAYWLSVACDNCGKVFVSETGLGACPVCDQEPEIDGPINNYIYPISVERIGGAEEAALAVKGLSLCILEHNDQHYLALTGCGMDMSWDIAEGYMRLGYLPPSHFADLPLFAGMQLNRTTRWVLAGMRRSLRLQIGWLKSGLSTVRHIRRSLAKRP
jgi:hypothetical protein